MDSSRTSSRLLWVDVAKAMAIMLIVVYHSVIFASAVGWIPQAVAIENALGALPMPLFFMVSGMFAARTLRRPWQDVLHRRVLVYAWLYVVWVLVRFTFFTVVPDVRDGAKDEDPSAVLTSLVLPATGLWFLYGLAVYSVAVKLAARISPLWQIGTSAALSVAALSGLIPIESWAWRNILTFMVFFVTGAHASDRITAFARRASTPRLVLTTLLATTTAAAVVVLHAERLPGAFLVQACASLAFAVVLAALLARTSLSAPLARLGARTLPVYLLHVLWIGGLVAAADAAGASPSGWAGAAAVMAVAAMSLALSLISYGLIQQHTPFLFGVPLRWRRDVSGEIPPARSLPTSAS